MKLLALAFAICGVVGLLIMAGDIGSQGERVRPRIADPAAFVAAARGVSAPSTDGIHVSLASEQVPAPLQAVNPVGVRSAGDHIDVITFKERDGELGYRVWREKPASPDAPSEAVDIFLLDNDWGQPPGPRNHE